MQAKVFSEWVQGRTCVTCAIVRKNTVCFGLEWSLEKDIEKSEFASYYLVHYLTEDAQEEPRDLGVRFRNGSRPRMAANPDAVELMIVFANRNVFYQTQKGGKSEKMLSRDDIVDANAVRYIGHHFYVAGGFRSVLRRDGPEQWTKISREIWDDSVRPEKVLSIGFDDVDGFDEADIYAVGGDGDVWHFDGRVWSRIDVPTNSELASVCCASDGQVYIGGVGHLVLRGRGERWDIVHEEDTNSIFQQIVEFNGRILTVDEWGNSLYEITRDGIAPLDMGDYSPPPTFCLCMAVGHGMLLVAGRESASLYDGKTWRCVFRSAEADDVMLIQMMLDQTNQALDRLLDDLEDLDKN